MLRPRLEQTIKRALNSTGIKGLDRGIVFVYLDSASKKFIIMSADQTNNKKPFGKSTRNNRDIERKRMEEAGQTIENDLLSGQPHQRGNEQKVDKFDHSQQIGEFSNWSRRG